VLKLAGRVASWPDSCEQRRGIGPVNQAITQVDEITEQNAALVAQAAA
jgi:methyl-accepting chemotaxis protein